MHVIRAFLGMLALATVALGQAAPVLTPQISPIVTWDADRGFSRPPTRRPLTAAELEAGRARADKFFDLVKATPSFSQPTAFVTLVTAWRVVTESGAVSDTFNAYWSAPADVTSRADGSLLPKMGGAHLIAYFETNRPPGAQHLVDPETRGNFSRTVARNGRSEEVFARPRTFGEVGGGTFYQTILVITRDGRPALEPAPVGPLLEVEIARLKKLMADADRGTMRSLEQLEASMTPQAKAERRARRADRWKAQYRNPETLAKELDAADRTDESDYQRSKERLTPPATRDPKSVYWGPRLATEALEQRLASLDASARAAGACGRVDPAFSPDNGVRFEPVASGGAGCVPMLKVREDLVDSKRPNDVQLLTVLFPESPCGEQWAGQSSLKSGRCDVAVPLMRELDWRAVRALMGW